MVEKVAIHWFRQDLRLSDNPALALAAKKDKVLIGRIMLRVNIIDNKNVKKIIIKKKFNK